MPPPFVVRMCRVIVLATTSPGDFPLLVPIGRAPAAQERVEVCSAYACLSPNLVSLQLAAGDPLPQKGPAEAAVLLGTQVVEPDDRDLFLRFPRLPRHLVSFRRRFIYGLERSGTFV